MDIEETSNGAWTVYMIECSDGSVYTGVTTDMKRRWHEHSERHGSEYSKSRGVLRLLWTEAHSFKVLAEKREAQIKNWTRAKKLALAEGNTDLLKKLSRSRSSAGTNSTL